MVNLLLKSIPRSSVFMESIDVSEIRDDANMLFPMLDDMVE